MDWVRRKAFLVTIAALIGLEWASVFLYGRPWARGFTPLGWTALVRGADILLFFLLFNALSVPVSAAGLKKLARGALTGLVVALILGSGVLLILHSIRWVWEVDLRAFLNPGITVRGLAPLAVLCLVGPFAEEIFFRGLCYTLIRAHTGVWVSVALSALLFGGSHLLSGNALGVVVLPLVGGVVLALLYEFSGSLLAPFILHAAGNFILFSRIF